LHGRSNRQSPKLSRRAALVLPIWAATAARAKPLTQSSKCCRRLDLRHLARSPRYRLEFRSTRPATQARWPLGDVTLDLDLVFPFPDVCNLVGRLHPEKGIHFRTESLLDPQRHVGREGGAAIEESGQGGPR